MDFVKELLWACLILGLPIVVLTFAMVWWALHRGIVETRDGVEALRKEIDEFGKARKKQKKKPPMNPVHQKWFEFGGGFYGLTALYTYLLVEFSEVVGFLASLPGIIIRLDIGQAIELFIRFLINSIMNFITAITWPLYWMREGGSNRFWLWLLVAYAGYWLGLRLAQYMAARQGLDTTISWSQDQETDKKPDENDQP
jgi:hypothetical protein